MGCHSRPYCFFLPLKKIFGQSLASIQMGLGENGIVNPVRVGDYSSNIFLEFEIIHKIRH